MAQSVGTNGHIWANLYSENFATILTHKVLQITEQILLSITKTIFGHSKECFIILVLPLLLSKNRTKNKLAAALKYRRFIAAGSCTFSRCTLRIQMMS